MKVNPVGKKLSEADRAYIAGFLDADGAIMATIERHQEKKFRFRVRVTVKISQSNSEILSWFKNKTGYGYIRRNRTAFDWVVRDQKFAGSLINDLLPYLRVKKRQALLVKKILGIQINTLSKLIKAAQLADTLSRFNIRSKGRRKNFVAVIQKSFSRND